MASCQLKSSARRLCEQCGSQNFEAWRLPTHNYWYEEKLHSTSYTLNCVFSHIAGLSPSTQYRVTVRAKQLRAPGQQSQQPPPLPGTTAQEHDSPGAYTDFRTLAKGLPDPPQVRTES